MFVLVKVYRIEGMRFSSPKTAVQKPIIHSSGFHADLESIAQEVKPKPLQLKNTYDP